MPGLSTAVDGTGVGFGLRVRAVGDGTGWPVAGCVTMAGPWPLTSSAAVKTLAAANAALPRAVAP
jgi:hypothetical protein